ncbi:MAG: hypothetical protein LAO05_15530 [Acidobacteriia bacterium]|nr:hypothetical protein [Terriglobia bacterium]
MDDLSVKLTPEEWHLISGLRDIPPSPLRDLMHEMMTALVEYVREPKCAEMQADGVPCSSPTADCEQCEKVRQLLTNLRHGVSQ